ncbi:peptidase M23-like protein [Saccharopolyspora erythraea NRRL 2338]|uniref:Metalloendopeptidase-like membrane protein n=2 Tax=Saccharopolyspora erythraea TaxID=1836 RepID=A4FP63_SACEN|nr:M23 family metallopeptidase [Saccharopolyspora erythraea]EQD84775.1 peptidase [Saccharopolyspora erythraea D]PFG99480.1 peptidase M23-like protein [Saccharopolyspora erythraea NRRL 2338]QRK89384.1 M23 family metallopeptidase [Saccharopolyspora erythraea]CAM05838.1 metalloendopeptidase-like membrane protein [Saccharopolyspora erythraea NRRL 2338]
MLRGRVVVAAVAAGAFVAAGQSMAAGEGHAADSDDFEFTANDASASFGTAADSRTGMGGAAPAPEVLPVTKSTSASMELEKLNRSSRVTEAMAQAEAARVAAEEAAKRPKVVAPAAGRFTSGFGGRWGTTHYGIDIANSKGTPIVSVSDGIVIEAGQASGFGLWVRVQHDDGTITVYGHVNTITVSEGDKVKAGDQIATMGNRGFSTGTHLHFEVWNASGKKVNPLPWLTERGVSVA